MFFCLKNCMTPEPLGPINVWITCLLLTLWANLSINCTGVVSSLFVEPRELPLSWVNLVVAMARKPTNYFFLFLKARLSETRPFRHDKNAAMFHHVWVFVAMGFHPNSLARKCFMVNNMSGIALLQNNTGMQRRSIITPLWNSVISLTSY